MISSNGPALSSHAERTGTGPCFPRWRVNADHGARATVDYANHGLKERMEGGRSVGTRLKNIH